MKVIQFDFSPEIMEKCFQGFCGILHGRSATIIAAGCRNESDI